ncbi:MAG: clostripain-related cysteine peptidase [Thermoplasmata archaeon]|nr:clostripain-related cysteine peptidase [Thermoplasmata archaeon]
MKSNVLKSIIALSLALLMALPMGIAVSGNEPVEAVGAPDAPSQINSQNAVAGIGDTLFNVWVEGPQHKSGLMFSMSSDSGRSWTEPETLTDSECNPMNVQIAAGTKKMHVVWQDGLSKLLRTGYLSIGLDGIASKIDIFTGESPAIMADGDTVAYSYVSTGTMNVRISYNDGHTFSQDQPMKGLICKDNRLAYSEGRVEMVAFGGIRDTETGQLNSRGLYFECLTCAWPAPQFLTTAGSVTDLSYDGTAITWSETAERTVFTYELSKKIGGEFGEKVLISSEDLPKSPASSPVPEARLPPKDWTFVCYLDGDNSLASFATTDINEMELVGSNDDLNIIALYDITGTADSKCYYVTYDTNTASIASTVIPLSNINPAWTTEVNMGDPQTAIDLMNYVYINYPAARYAWDFWNHGGSWTWMQCEDAVSGDELTALETREIYETLRTDTGRTYLWDVLTFDECITADNEVAYDAKQYANYSVFSEDSIAGDGFDYTDVLNHLKNNPAMGGEEFSAWVCHEYYADYPTGTSLSTLAAINNTAYDYELMEAIENFGQKMRHKASTLNAQIKSAASSAMDWQGITYQPDLRHFAQLIAAGISNATDAEINAAAWNVIALTASNAASDTYGSGTWVSNRPILIHDANTNANGLTIYANQAYDTTFNTLALASYSNWGKFVQNVWGTPTNVVNEEPICFISSPAEGGSVVTDSFVTISGTASDTDGTVQRVEVKIEREAWQTATGTNSWTYSWNTAGWPVGPIHIQARSYDGVDYSSGYDNLNVEIVDVSSNGTIAIQFAEYPAEALVQIQVKDTDLNTGTGVQTTTINVKSAAEPAGESLVLTETGGDTSVFEGAITISRTNGAGILWVNAADMITATYVDMNYGGTGQRTLTDTADVDGTPPGAASGLTVEWYGLAQQEFFFEDFEGDGTPTFAELGWTTGGASNDWQIGTPQGLGTPADPLGSYSGLCSIGNDLTGLGTYPGEYENSLVADSNYIYSPALDCSGFSEVQVQFARFLGVESPSYDHANIEVSRSTSGPWTTVWTNSGTISDTSWSTVTYDISTVADGQPAVYLRFELGGTDGSVTYCGWNIDDLALVGMTSGTMHNTLNWTLSSDDGAGANDVVAYNIYRSASEAGPWDAANLISSLGSGTDTYLDMDRGEYDGTNWWYVVRAEDNLGNEESNTNAIPEIPTSNIAPSAPNNPTPANGATGVSVNPTLSVRAADPNGDTMTVRFYNAAGSILIGTNTNVPSGTITNIVWNGRLPLTSYSWYATADDGEFITPSATWSFTTMDTTPPGPVTGLTVEWTGTSSATLIDQPFSSGTMPPTGWAVSSSGTAGTWSSSNTATAGGTAPEAMFSYGDNADGTCRLYAGPFDTTGMTSLDLQWRNMIDDYTSGSGVVCAVQTSSDLSSWYDVWYWDDTITSGDLPAALLTATVTTPSVGSSTFYIAWVVDGNSYQMNYWYVDNILLTYTGGTTTDDNLLTWTLSADDGAGADDVTQYNIYRSDVMSGPWDASHIIDTAPAGTNTFTDPGRGETDGIYWWYVVRAEDVWGNEETNTNAVQEPGGGGIPYSISLLGRTAGTWAFVSYPVTVSGHIETVFNDTANGDSGTNWDVAKTWDNQLKKWLSYRKGGSANTFTNVDNLKGYWLHLTSNAADQLLSIPSTGAYPGTLTINLYMGWNLVGYPSATGRLASATLPAQADIVSEWQSTSPYIVDRAPSDVTMSHGKGYWVHVTADCVWTVNP